MSDTKLVQQVCIGNRETDNGKMVQYWNRIEDGKLVDYVFSFSKPVPRAGVGNVYTFIYQVEPDGSMTRTWLKGSNAPAFSHQWANREQVLEWEMLHKKANTVKALRSKQAAIESEFTAALMPIREQYRKTNAAGKAALLALVIQEITRG